MACPDDSPTFVRDRARPRRIAAAAITAALQPSDDESDRDYFLRVGAHYLADAEGWDDEAYAGHLCDVDVAGLRLSVPASRAWGKARVTPDGLAWRLHDAEFIVTMAGDLRGAPSAQAWIDVRRTLLAKVPGWTVVGGRALRHPLGAAIEVAEVCRLAPRAVRVCRWLFAPPMLVAVGVVTHDAVPRARARELVAMFASIRR